MIKRYSIRHTEHGQIIHLLAIEEPFLTTFLGFQIPGSDPHIVPFMICKEIMIMANTVNGDRHCDARSTAPFF